MIKKSTSKSEQRWEGGREKKGGTELEELDFAAYFKRSMFLPRLYKNDNIVFNFGLAVLRQLDTV